MRQLVGQALSDEAVAADQAELSNTMASRGVDKFADVAWSPSEATGSPILDGTLAHLDCTIHSVHEAGDHYVVIGRVLDLATSEGTGRCRAVRELKDPVDWRFPTWSDLAKSPSG